MYVFSLEVIKIGVLKRLEISLGNSLIFILISVFLKPVIINYVFILNISLNGSNKQQIKLIKLAYYFFINKPESFTEFKSKLYLQHDKY